MTENRHQHRETYPSREQFLADPRAKEIRQLTLDVVRVANDILVGPAGLSPDARLRAYAQLEHLQGQLLAAGVTPDMHARDGGFSAEERSNPVVVAEWAAGQILPLCGQQLQTTTEAMLAAQEHGESAPNPLPQMNYLLYKNLLPGDLVPAATKMPRRSDGRYPFAPNMVQQSLLNVTKYLDPTRPEDVPPVHNEESSA